VAAVLCTDHVLPDPLVRQGFEKVVPAAARFASRESPLPLRVSLVDHFE